MLVALATPQVTELPIKPKVMEGLMSQRLRLRKDIGWGVVIG
jgi:hypothetical protein